MPLFFLNFFFKILAPLRMFHPGPVPRPSSYYGPVVILIEFKLSEKNKQFVIVLSLYFIKCFEMKQKDLAVKNMPMFFKT